MTLVLNQTFASRTQQLVGLGAAPGGPWPRLTARLGEPVGALTGDGRPGAHLKRTEVPWLGTINVADLPGHPRMERRCLIPVAHRLYSLRFLAGVLGADGLDLVMQDGEAVSLRDFSGIWANWGTPEQAYALLDPRPARPVLHRALS